VTFRLLSRTVNHFDQCLLYTLYLPCTC